VRIQIADASQSKRKANNTLMFRSIQPACCASKERYYTSAFWHARARMERGPNAHALGCRKARFIRRQRLSRPEPFRPV